MNAAATIAMCLALGVSIVAAFCDWRRGEIPNWLTLPPVVAAPLAYGSLFGIEHAFHSGSAAFLSGLVPYLLFRRGAIGGGDVKLFAALGATTGFDLAIGIEIELGALAVAMFVSCAALAWKGVLLSTLSNALAQALRPVLPVGCRQTPCGALATPVRLGMPVLAAAGIVAAPYLALAWSEL